MKGIPRLPDWSWCLLQHFVSDLPLYMIKGSTSNAGYEIKPAAGRFMMDPYCSPDIWMCARCVCQPIAYIKTHDFINNSISNAGVGCFQLLSIMIDEGVVVLL